MVSLTTTLLFTAISVTALSPTISPTPLKGFPTWLTKTSLKGLNSDCGKTAIDWDPSKFAQHAACRTAKYAKEVRNVTVPQGQCYSSLVSKNVAADSYVMLFKANKNSSKLAKVSLCESSDFFQSTVGGLYNLYLAFIFKTGCNQISCNGIDRDDNFVQKVYGGRSGQFTSGDFDMQSGLIAGFDKAMEDMSVTHKSSIVNGGLQICYSFNVHGTYNIVINKMSKDCKEEGFGSVILDQSNNSPITGTCSSVLKQMGDASDLVTTKSGVISAKVVCQ